jgi:hypothetical protein
MAATDIFDVTLAGIKTDYQVRLIKRSDRWWWFVIHKTSPDPICVRGDALDPEGAIGQAMYEARKLLRRDR